MVNNHDWLENPLVYRWPKQQGQFVQVAKGPNLELRPRECCWGVEMFTHQNVDVWGFLPIIIGKFANLWTDVFFFINNNRDLLKLIGSIEILSSEQLEFYHDWRDKQKSWGYQPALAACGDVIYYNETIGCKQLGLATLSSTMMAFLRSSEVGIQHKRGAFTVKFLFPTAELDVKGSASSFYGCR